MGSNPETTRLINTIMLIIMITNNLTAVNDLFGRKLRSPRITELRDRFKNYE